MLRSFVVESFVVAVDSTGAATRAAVRRGIETNSALALSYRSSREPPAPRIVPQVRYLEHGSVRALAEDLDRQGIRTKVRQLASGRTVGGANVERLTRSLADFPKLTNRCVRIECSCSRALYIGTIDRKSSAS